MKKITLLLLIITSFTYGQVLSEDFEAGLTLPAGWTNNDLAVPPIGEIWTFETGGEAGGFTVGNTLLYDFGELEGNYATMDSDGYGNNGAAEETTLVSPVFSCAALTQVTLNFNHLINGSFGGVGSVEVFNGSSWVTVITYPTAADGSAPTISGLESLDVTTELAGVANAQIRFSWVGNWSISWSVDNISVFECIVSAPDAATAATAPTDGQTDVVINYSTGLNNIGPFEWTAAITGDPADSFNLSLGTNLAGDDIGTLGNFPSGNSINFDWQPNTQYFWFVEAVNCAGTTAGPVWSFTTQACIETAPSSVITPGPADGATLVPIAGPDGLVNFSWANGAGDPGSSFTLNLDTVDPPVANSFTDFANGGPITGLAVNTEYFWSIDAVNCAGTTTGTVWSFTTDTTLSIGNIEIAEPFKIYPNPTSGVLNIKTSLEIDTIIVSNLLGQQVANFNKNSISNNSVNLSELANGIYLVTVAAGDKAKTFKITKQ